MAKATQVKVITRETIKPASSTPEHRRHFRLSLLDYINFPMSTPVVLFYPLKSNHHTTNVISQQLKSSLSETLTLFYPLAGRLKDNYFIECDDYGVDYIEAQVSCQIQDIIGRPCIDVLENLIPIDLNSAKSSAIIQVNFFACGGLAIGIGISHKICDGASLGIFIMNWANRSLADKNSIRILAELLPVFISDSIIPSVKDSIIVPPPPPPMMLKRSCTTRRYVFDAPKVALLQAKAASASVQQPTRVEAVVAFLWKCLIATSKLKPGSPRQSALVQAVNLRKRLPSPVPQNYVGNLSIKFLAETERSDAELQDLVALSRKGLEETCDRVRKGVTPNAIISYVEELKNLHSRDGIDVYSLSSLCGFPLYENDFGWGRPTWVIVTNLLLKNYGVLMDARDGKGIEVWLCLGEEDWPLFERNQEVLAFASINPGRPLALQNDVPNPNKLKEMLL